MRPYEPYVNHLHLALATLIETETHEHISDSTIKRLWKPSLGYATVSTHTLNLLSCYAGYPHFEEFCRKLSENGILESELYADKHGIRTVNLSPGTLLHIAWLPDRECTLRYLGDNRFEAVETHKSKLQPGDTFSCSGFTPGRPVYVDNLQRGGESFDQYAIGTAHGLTRVEIVGDK